jgi:hypothetical protein
MKAKQLLGYNERSPNPILPVIAGLYQKKRKMNKKALI